VVEVKPDISAGLQGYRGILDRQTDRYRSLHMLALLRMSAEQIINTV